MGLFNFRCKDCSHYQEHFVNNPDKKKSCPQCSSSEYTKQVGMFRTSMVYADNDDFMEKEVQPLVDEVFEKIGKEAASEGTKTAENIFGADKVEKSIYGYDE